MATKTILGDDPFAAAGGEDKGKEEEKAAKLRKKPAGKKKKSEDVPMKARNKKAAPQAEAATPEPATSPSPSPTTSTTTSTSTSTTTPMPQPAPEPPVVEAEPDYGPSIDHEESAGQIRQVIDHVREIERQVRERFGAPEPRRRLPLEFLWKRYRSIAMRDRSDVVDEFGRDPQVAARIDPLLDFLYKRYFRVEAEGMGHIPDGGRALIVANHSGTLPYDGAMIMHAVQKDHPAQRPVRPLVEDFVFHFPYLGTLMNRIGGVRACQENAERLLQQDQLVAVFPEGIKGIGKLYAQRYQLQRFGRGGFIKLALATDSPIIPTAVVGAEEIHPMVTKITWLAKSVGIPYIPITPTFPFLGPIGLLPLPTKWYLAFGEPLYFNAEYGSAAASDRILVNKLAEQVRQRIQEMIDSLLAKRRSVLFG